MKKTLIALLILPLTLVGLLFSSLNVYAMESFDELEITNRTVNEYPVDWNNAQTAIWHDHIVGTRAYVHLNILKLNTDVGLADASSVVGNVKTNASNHIFKFGNIGDTLNDIRKYSQFNDFYQFSMIGNPDMVNFQKFVIEIVDGDQIITAYTSNTPVIQFAGPEQYAYSHLDPYGVQVGSDVLGIGLLELDQDYNSGFPVNFGPDMKHMFVLQPGINYRMYWTQGTTEIDVTVDDLPVTTGSPFNKDGQIGTASFEVDQLTHEVVITVHYGADTFTLTKVILDSVEFLENVNNVYYYTDNGNKYLTFAYDDAEPVFLHNRFTSKKWSDSAVWNLTTNEIKTVNIVTAFSHIYSDKDDFLYNIMYIPDIIVDDVLQVSLTFKYQYYYHFTGKGQWQYETRIVEKDEKIEVLPTWERKLYSWLIAPAYGLAVNTGIKLPFTLPYLIYSLLYERNTAYNVVVGNYKQSISKYTATSDMISALNSEWSLKSGSTVSVPNNSLYLLNLGQYSKFGSKEVLVDPLGNDPLTGYTEIVFVTNGQVRHLEKSQIFTIGTVDKDNDPSNYPDKGWWESLMDFFQKVGKWGSLVIFILAGGLTAPVILSFFKNIFGTKANKKRAFISLTWIGVWIILWAFLW